MSSYRYHTQVLDSLSRHGVVPTDRTPPQFVRDFLSGLYRWEIRKLRDRLRARAFPKHEYVARVVAIRQRYILLSIPVETWATGGPGDGVSGAAPETGV